MSAAAVVTLTTDWGEKDAYIAQLKAALYTALPQVPCFDITHAVSPFNVNQTAYLLDVAWQHYPCGSVHIIGVDTEASIHNPHVVVQHQGHYFIGADNGIFTLLFPHADLQAYEIEMYQQSNKFTFPARDVFVPVAIRLLQGEPLSAIGVPYTAPNKRRAFQPVIDAKSIKTRVIYIDAYHNVVCDLREDVFKRHSRRRPFRIHLSSEFKLSSISTAYGDTKEGLPLVLFNTAGYLEVAINKGKAAGLLGLRLNDIVHIDLL